MAEQLLLRVDEAAQRIGVSRAAAFRLVAEGKLPAVRLSPRCLRVPAAALERWAQVQAEQALSAAPAGAGR